MVTTLQFALLVLTLGIACCLSLRKEQLVVNPKAFASASDDCDPSTIPVMNSFDIKKFSGKWFELAKTSSGYIDVADGMWRIEGGPNSTNVFLFSGRDNNGHCIRPIKGKISDSKEPPGLLNLRYQTYSTHVEETIRVLFTDYTSVAVIYTCMHHVHHEREVCHAAGLFGSIWTRSPHVDVDIYKKAVSYLEMACIHQSMLMIANLVGPCKVDDLGFRIDDFPAPDFCYQPVDQGSCRGSLQRYFYDPKERTCRIFTYGGCGGNRNNFMSLPECQEKCVSASSKEPICMSTAKCAIHCSPCCTEDRNGCVQCSCEHIIEDDFFNCVKSPQHCQPECESEEIYPGCHICKCEGEYKPYDESAVCLEVKEVGSCNENVERFYYDAIADKCEKFIYSGCNGNNNNFQSLQECREKCKVSDHRATLIEEEDQGPDISSTIKYSIWIIGVMLLLLHSLQLYLSHSYEL